MTQQRSRLIGPLALAIFMAAVLLAVVLQARRLPFPAGVGCQVATTGDSTETEFHLTCNWCDDDCENWLC